MKVTILYARVKSEYKELGDAWDIKRDARMWPGGNAVVAHPPCRGWGKLRHMAKPRTTEKSLAIHSVIMVRLWGGVLEHPEWSTLWEEMKLPKPNEKPDQYGGWTMSIDQKWFGHRARKRTWLYIVGCKAKEIPAYPINLEKAVKTVEDMGQAERERTPRALAEWLVKLAEKINDNKRLRIN